MKNFIEGSIGIKDYIHGILLFYQPHTKNPVKKKKEINIVQQKLVFNENTDVWKEEWLTAQESCQRKGVGPVAAVFQAVALMCGGLSPSVQHTGRKKLNEFPLTETHLMQSTMPSTFCVSHLIPALKQQTD